ncbi:MAG: hypothetical protein RLY31_3181, partial [Bacteroidota bacterium]
VLKKSFIFTMEGTDPIRKQEAFQIFNKYILMAYHRHSDQIIEAIEDYFHDVVPVKGSVADILLNQGREEGLEKGLEIERLAGRLEDLSQILRKLTDHGYDTATMSLLSGLPLPFVQAFV